MEGFARKSAAVVAAVAVAATLTAAAAPDDDGKAIFHGKGACFACHGKEGVGTPLGPSLRDTVWLHLPGPIPPLAAVKKLITEGVASPKKHPAPMPAMGGAKLTDAELDAVAKYVLSLPAPAEK